MPSAAEMGFYCELLYDRLYKRLAYDNIAPGEPKIIFYHGEEYTERNLDVEADVVDAGVLEEEIRDDLVGFRREPGVDEAASLAYRGPLAELLPAVLALPANPSRQELALAGPLQEIYRSGRAHEAGAETAVPVTELLVPIQRLEI